jgi:hypothetical protein
MTPSDDFMGQRNGSTFYSQWLIKTKHLTFNVWDRERKIIISIRATQTAQCFFYIELRHKFVFIILFSKLLELTFCIIPYLVYIFWVQRNFNFLCKLLSVSNVIHLIIITFLFRIWVYWLINSCVNTVIKIYNL